MSLFKSLCKYTATIRFVRDIPNTLRKAIQIAQSGTPGPVFVEFPIDSLYPYHLVQRELGVKGDAKSFVQRMINAYLNNYLYSLFAGAFDKQNLSPLPTDIRLATPHDGKFTSYFTVNFHFFSSLSLIKLKFNAPLSYSAEQKSQLF